MEELTFKATKTGLLIICLMALTAGVTYAVIMFYIDVPMTLEVGGSYELELYEADGVTPLTGIDFGTLLRGSEMEYIGPYILRNVGDYDVYLSWGLTGWPADVWVSVATFNEEGGSVPMFEGQTSSIPIPVGAEWQWYIYYEVDADAVLDTYTPTLRWNSHDVPIVPP